MNSACRPSPALLTSHAGSVGGGGGDPWPCRAGESAPVCCSLLAHNGEPGCEPSTHPEPPRGLVKRGLCCLMSSPREILCLQGSASGKCCRSWGLPSGALEFSFPASGQRLGKSGTGPNCPEPTANRGRGEARPWELGRGGVDPHAIRGGPTGVLDHVPKARSRSSMVGVSYQAITSSMSHAGRRP